MSSERELDEGIQSIKSAWRREHTARTNLEKMLEQAEAENARLRSELESVGAAAYLYGRGDLLAENAKLRDLLEAVLQCAGEIKRDEGCDACPMYNGPSRNDGPWCLLRLTMRELGVDE